MLEAQLFADYAVRVDCKAGCGACCHLAKIDARAHEVFALEGAGSLSTANWC